MTKNNRQEGTGLSPVNVATPKKPTPDILARIKKGCRKLFRRNKWYGRCGELRGTNPTYYCPKCDVRIAKYEVLYAIELEIGSLKGRMFGYVFDGQARSVEHAEKLVDDEINLFQERVAQMKEGLK